jgi:Pilin accessory protein (PilO)
MAKTHSLEAPTLLDHTSGLAPVGTCLVAGLWWKPLLGQHPEKMATSEAKKGGGTHYVHTGKTSYVGFTHLPKTEKTQYVSLASLLANATRSNTVFLALSINSSMTWICAVANGSVLSGYDLVTSSPEVCRATRDRFSKRFPEAEYWGDVEGLDLKPVFTWESLSDQLANAEHLNQARLRPVGKGVSFSLSAVPRPIIWIVCLGTMALVGQKVVVPTVSSLFGSKEEVVYEDPEMLWNDALENQFNAVKVSAPGSLDNLLTSVNELPTLVAGWRLATITCDWGAQAWLCKAHYKASSRKHTNEAFAAARPQHWKLNWSLPLDANGTFTLPAQSVSRSMKTLRAVGDHELTTASHFQALSPLMSAGVPALQAFTPVAIAPPSFQKGEPVPLPASIRLPMQSAVKAITPMRTGAIADEWANEVAWTNATFTFDTVKEPRANDSAAMMDLKGTIYAKP